MSLTIWNTLSKSYLQRCKDNTKEYNYNYNL